MERKYPAGMFWFSVLTNFLFHFFYLFLPGFVLCIAGIWVKSCLRIGLAILLLDLGLSIVEQMRIRKALLTSTNPDVKDLVDALCGPGGLEDFGKVLDERIKSAQAADTTEEQTDHEQ